MSESASPAVLNPVLPPGFQMETSEERPERDADRFLTQAKQHVIDNYNKFHDAPLTLNDVYILMFAKAGANWKALVGSQKAKGMIWIVSFTGGKQMAEIQIYKMLNDVKISTRRVKK
jgi:uncharacterized protein DUF6275